MFIAICNDEEKLREEIRRLMETQAEAGQDFQDILFLDVPMEEVKGSELQQIFLQAVKEYRDIQGRRQEGMKEIQVRSNNRIRTILEDDIYYIESSNRQVILYLQAEQIAYYNKISELEEALWPDFFRIHRGYLIHMRYVEGYDRTEVWMKNGDRLPISKYKYQEFARAYQRYCLKEDAEKGMMKEEDT